MQSPSAATALPLPIAAPPPAEPARAVPRTAADDARLRAIVREHYDFLWRSLRRLGVHEEGVDDAAQQVLLVLSRRLGDVPPGNERAFVFGTATRVASDVRKSRTRRAAREVRDERAAGERADTAPTSDELVDQRRARELLDEVLEALPTQLRTVFVLAEFEDMTMSEIAEIVGVPHGTVASRLRRARALFEEYAADLQRRLGEGRSA